MFKKILKYFKNDDYVNLRDWIKDLKLGPWIHAEVEVVVV